MNHSRCKHDGGPDDVEEGDDDGHGHDAGDQRQQHEGQRDESELESQLKRSPADTEPVILGVFN